MATITQYSQYSQLSMAAYGQGLGAAPLSVALPDRRPGTRPAKASNSFLVPRWLNDTPRLLWRASHA
jgi:hypothetical protein